MDVKVYHRFNVRPSEFNSPCSESCDKYELQDGELKKVGTDYFYDKIQSFRGMYNVQNIVKRYAAGDVSALGSPGGQYIDVSCASNNLADYTQAKIEAAVQKAFNGLADDFRNTFADYTEFGESLEKGTFYDRLKQFTDKRTGNGATGQSANSGVDGGNK